LSRIGGRLLHGNASGSRAMNVYYCILPNLESGAVLT
jgi:hypothetical protein